MTSISTSLPDHYLPFLVLVASIMAVLGLGLGVLKLALPETLPKKKETIAKVWTAYRAWFVLAPTVFLVVWLGPGAVTLGVSILAAYLVKEFMKATGLYRSPIFVLTIYAAIGLLAFASHVAWYEMFVVVPIVTIAVLMMLPSFLQRYDGMIQRVGLSIMALVYIAWFLSHLSFLTNHLDWVPYMLYLVMATELNDASAYLFGHALGKHKLIPDISPGKTVEGSLGALLVLTVFTFGMRIHLPNVTTELAMLFCVTIWIGGTLGDLAISWMKRDLDIKDLGQSIPGHGGLLDRCDSLLLTAPLFFHLIKYFLWPS